MMPKYKAIARIIIDIDEDIEAGSPEEARQKLVDRIMHSKFDYWIGEYKKQRDYFPPEYKSDLLSKFNKRR